MKLNILDTCLHDLIYNIFKHVSVVYTYNYNYYDLSAFGQTWKLLLFKYKKI